MHTGRFVFKPATFGKFIMAAIAAGCSAITVSRAIAVEPAAGSHSIFDDDFPSAKDSAPAKPATPATPTTPAPAPARVPAAVAPPANNNEAAPPVLPPANPPAVDPQMIPGLIAELDDTAGVVKETRLVKRVRVTLSTPIDKAVPLIFRWHGLVNIPTGGMRVSFRFSALATAEVKLDGKKVADERSGQVLQLAAGPHPVEVSVSEVFGQGGRITIWLGWAPAGEEFQPVPSAVFFHTAAEEPKGLRPAAGAADLLSGHGGVIGDQGMPVSVPPPAPAPGVVVPPATPLTPPAPPARRAAGTVPPPTEAQLADMRREIKAKYIADYSDTSRIVRQALVKKLTDAAADRSNTPPMRYAFLREASDIAVAIGDLKTALTCVDEISGAFKANEPELTLNVLIAAARLPKTVGIGHEVGDGAMALADRARDDNDFELAIRATQIAETAYGATSADGTRAKNAMRDLREVQAQYARVAPLLKKLAETPDDTDLNIKAGRYFCFSVGNWDKGMPMLAKGSDVALKALANAEASPPTDGDGEIRLGDSWWDKAGSESLLGANACKRRAAFWYDKGRAHIRDATPPRVIERLSTLSRTIDLLPLVEVGGAADSVNLTGNPRLVKAAGARGTWTRDHDTLVSSNGFFATPVELPYRPAGEYDFSVEFYVPRGTGSVTQMLPVRGVVLQWTAEGEDSNFTSLALRRGSFGPMLRGRVPIVAGQKYVSLVQFRRTGVRGYLNGVLIREWSTDYSELGNSFAKLPDPQCLGVFASGEQVVISAIRVVEIGRGSK